MGYRLLIQVQGNCSMLMMYYQGMHIKSYGKNDHDADNFFYPTFKRTHILMELEVEVKDLDS